MGQAYETIYMYETHNLPQDMGKHIQLYRESPEMDWTGAGWMGVGVRVKVEYVHICPFASMP